MIIFSTPFPFLYFHYSCVCWWLDRVSWFSEIKFIFLLFFHSSLVSIIFTQTFCSSLILSSAHSNLLFIFFGGFYLLLNLLLLEFPFASFYNFYLLLIFSTWFYIVTSSCSFLSRMPWTTVKFFNSFLCEDKKVLYFFILFISKCLQCILFTFFWQSWCIYVNNTS